MYLEMLTLVEAVALGTIGTVGNEGDNPRFSDGQGFYLNLADRANSSGIVTSVNYCYAIDTNAEIRDLISNGVKVLFQATVGFYRPSSTGEGNSSPDVDNTFQLVRSFILNTTDAPPLIPQQNFICSTVSIDPVTVEIGDAIGVCTRNFGQSRRLIFNAETSNRNDVIRRGSDLCDMQGEVPGTIDNDELEDRYERTLLISTNIGKLDA